MRLLKTDTFELVEFVGEGTPKYAILSHTWEGKEVSFRDIQDQDALTYLNADEPPTPAWAKIKNACRQARKDSFEFIWIDTCCIDKSSSAELQEAINSMFAWYRKSAICYAFLSDIHERPRPNTVQIAGAFHFDISYSRWFTRGWTLQELLAPDFLYFFDASWEALGSRNLWATSISQKTAIPAKCLTGPEYGEFNIYQDKNASLRRVQKSRESIEDKLQHITVAARMSWAANRQTTRVEDEAYCLLGLFDINMPMLYGEGNKAFMRLQQEIMKTSDDATILAWGYGMPIDGDAYIGISQGYVMQNPQEQYRKQTSTVRPRPLFATSPEDYRFAGTLKRYRGGEDLSLDFGISQRGLMLDGFFGIGDRDGLCYLFLPCTDANRNVLALPMLGLFDLYSPSYRCFANGFCAPIATAHTVDNMDTFGLSRGERRKYYLGGKFNNLSLPSIGAPFFHSRFLELRFMIQSPWPRSTILGFRLETVYPPVSNQPFRFVSDISTMVFDIQNLHLDLDSSDSTPWGYNDSRSCQSHIFIVNITGKRILLALGVWRGRRISTPPVCHAAILEAEASLRPTLADLAAILRDPSERAPRIFPHRHPSSTSEASFIFNLSPGLDLCAKWIKT